MEIFVLDSDKEAGGEPDTKRLRVWEQLLAEPAVPEDIGAWSQMVEPDGVEMGRLEHLLPERVPQPLPADFDGPVGWVSRLRFLFSPLFASLGKQLQPVTMHHLCAGTGSASVALKALG